MVLSPIEKEIIKVTKAKPQNGETRQKYLQSLAVRVAEINEVVFDSMSKPAQDWGNAAIEAINESKDLPDFADPVTTEEVAAKQTEEVAKVVKKAGKVRRSSGTAKDAFGYRVGSKTSDVIAAFVEGAKMSEIKQRFGSPHYNVLKSLEQAGHKVERVGGAFKITHKDQAG